MSQLWNCNLPEIHESKRRKYWELWRRFDMYSCCWFRFRGWGGNICGAFIHHGWGTPGVTARLRSITSMIMKRNVVFFLPILHVSESTTRKCCFQVLDDTSGKQPLMVILSSQSKGSSLPQRATSQSNYLWSWHLFLRCIDACWNPLGSDARIPCNTAQYGKIVHNIKYSINYIHILHVSIQKIRMEIPTKALRTQEREGVPEKRADVAATLHHWKRIMKCIEIFWWVYNFIATQCEHMKKTDNMQLQQNANVFYVAKISDLFNAHVANVAVGTDCPRLRSLRRIASGPPPWRSSPAAPADRDLGKGAALGSRVRCVRFAVHFGVFENRLKKVCIWNAIYENYEKFTIIF